MKMNPRLCYDYYKTILSLHHKGIYVPLYNGAPIDETTPPIYNEYGERMQMFYFRDIHSTNTPYGDKGRYFIMDRYNYGLKTHFYSNMMMFYQLGQPINKYGMMLESRSIAASEYKYVEKHISQLKEFKVVYTYDDQLLNKLSNSCFYPAAATIWYKNGVFDDGGRLAHSCKNKNISIISSSKRMCEIHRLRADIAWKCKKRQDIDTFGTFDGSQWNPSIDGAFQYYRYSIVIENNVADYYFTEKILNCFAAQTIPIYVGARKIGDFFNPEGIIIVTIDELQDLDWLVRKCDQKYYEEHLSAVMDNYERVKKYGNLGDLLFELVSPTMSK